MRRKAPSSLSRASAQAATHAARAVGAAARYAAASTGSRVGVRIITAHVDWRVYIGVASTAAARGLGRLCAAAVGVRVAVAPVCRGR
jgi:hypothetical protein